jgi:hypothetical protein
MNVAQRIKGETPGFFKKIIRIAITAGVIAGGILGAPLLVAPLGVSLVIPVAVKTVLGWVVAGSAMAATTAKTVVTPEAIELHDAKEAEKKNEANITQ